jgi:hypothetical protein
MLNREAFAVTFLPHFPSRSVHFRLKLFISNGFSVRDLCLDPLVFAQVPHSGEKAHVACESTAMAEWLAQNTYEREAA